MEVCNASETNNDYSWIEKLVDRNCETLHSEAVTVIIPYYRDIEVLSKSLCGLSQQTYPRERFDVLIGDESEEGVRDLVTSFQPYMSIRSIRQEHKGFRISTLLNKLVQSARNEIIVQLDFDMIPLPTHLERHMRWFCSSARVATIGPRRFIDASGISPDDLMGDIRLLKECPDIRSTSNTGGGTMDKRLTEFQYFKRHPFPGNCFHGCNVAYRKEDAVSVGLYDEDFNLSFGYEDLEFGCRLSKSGVFLVHEPGAMAFHQENTVVSEVDKARGRDKNRVLLYQKVPGIAEFRNALERQRMSA